MLHFILFTCEISASLLLRLISGNTPVCLSAVPLANLSIEQEGNLLLKLWSQLFNLCFFLHSTGCMSATRAGNERALFQSIGPLSHCVVSLVNLPGVISAKIRLSIMSNYRQACGPHSVFALLLTPAPHHATSPAWSGKYLQWSESMLGEAAGTVPQKLFLVHVVFCKSTLVESVNCETDVYDYTWSLDSVQKEYVLNPPKATEPQDIGNLICNCSDCN